MAALADGSDGKKKDNRPELDHEKSKVGLGEVYEREFLKKTSTLAKDMVGGAEAEESKEHLAVRSVFAALVAKLDALTNFHFTPKAPVPEVSVKSNAVPAISMEEKIPLGVAGASVRTKETEKF